MALLKNPGPLLTTNVSGDEDAVPREWRAKLGLVKTSQENPTDVQPDPITAPGLLILSEAVQTRTDERKKVNTLVSAPLTTTMIAQERLSNGQIVTRTRSFQQEGTPLSTVGDPTVIEAGQKNLGVGKLDQFIVQAVLPGPSVVSSKFDTDSSLVSETKTRKLITAITEGEILVGGFRVRTSREGETDLVATEVISKDPVPGPMVPSSRIDSDGTLVTILKTEKPVTSIVDGETLFGNVWTKTYKEGETPLVAVEVKETRTIPGVTTIANKIDDDGFVITFSRTRKAINAITAGETVSGGIWTRTYKEAETFLVATEVREFRAIPGSPIPSTKIDSDGKIISITKTKKATVTIADQELISGGLWIKRYHEAISGLVAYQIDESRPIPGAAIPSASIDNDMEIVTLATTLKQSSLITPGATLSGTTITTTEQKQVSDLVSQELVSVKTFLNKQAHTAAIDNPVPSEFRPFITTQEDSNTVGGTATLPTLVQDELSRTEQQKDRLLKQVTVSKLLPSFQSFVEYEITPQFGGLILDVSKTFDTATNIGSIPPADLTTPSVIREKITRHGRFAVLERAVAQTGFPSLVGNEVDTTLNLIRDTYTKQVVPAGTTGGVGTHSSTEITPLDAARSEKMVRTGSDLSTFMLIMFGTSDFSFPPVLSALVGIISAGAGAGSYGESGGYTIYNGGSESIHLQGEASGNASVTMDLVPVITQTWSQNVPVTQHLFFAEANASYATILARVTPFYGTLNQWPKFRPQAHTFTCISRKISGSARGSIHHSDSVVSDFNGAVTHYGNARTQGLGGSVEFETIITAVRIPPTIHGAVTVTNSSSPTQSFLASGFVATNLANQPFSVSQGTNGQIFPTSIPATVGQTSIPTTGFYMTKLRMEPYAMGWNKVFVEVVAAVNF